MNKQVKSKERVSKHGEVFTSEKDVNTMLDLVKNETLRVDSRFLEPACGDGNFLAEILKRKLAVAKKMLFRQDEKKLNFWNTKNNLLSQYQVYTV